MGGAPGGRGEPSAQLPEPLSPARAVARCFRRPGADRRVFLRSSASRRSTPRVPALGVPPPRLASTRRRSRAMPRYELALILKAMRRVSDLPSDRFPRGPSPPPLGLPAPRPRLSGHRAGPLAQSVHGRPGAQRGRAWVGRSARPCGRGRRGRGVCARACARSREGGVPCTQGPRLASDPGPPESGERTAGGHAREPRPAPFYSHASRSCSWSPPAARPRPPVLSVSDQYNLPPKPVGAGCVPHTLAPAVTFKKKFLLTSLFLTSAKILLLVPLAQFHSSNGGLACAFRRHVLPPTPTPSF